MVLIAKNYLRFNENMFLKSRSFTVLDECERCNVQKNLIDLNIKDGNYINELFGKKPGDIQVKGVLDSKAEEKFQEEWSKLEQIWSSRGVHGVTFLHYMNTFKKDLMKK